MKATFFLLMIVMSLLLSGCEDEFPPNEINVAEALTVADGGKVKFTADNIKGLNCGVTGDDFMECDYLLDSIHKTSVFRQSIIGTWKFIK